jgi:hypothetical protein
MGHPVCQCNRIPDEEVSLRLWLLILLPFGLVQAAEFKLTGRTTGSWPVDGQRHSFMIDERTRFKDGLDEDDLGGPGSIWKGRAGDGGRGAAARSRGGGAGRGTRWNWKGRWKGIWGYVTSDGSLSPFEGRWLELECKFDGMRLSRCRKDD